MPDTCGIKGASPPPGIVVVFSADRMEGSFLENQGSLAAARGKSTVSKWSGDKLRGGLVKIRVKFELYTCNALHFSRWIILSKSCSARMPREKD